MIRYLALFACIFSSPVSAWDFSSLPICTVSDEGSATALTVTFDGTLYALDLENPEGWPEAAVFAIRFIPNGPVIQTDKHRIRGNVLSVIDNGFGNVLIGLQFNHTAQIILGDTVREIDLKGADEPVEAFRNCKPDASLS